MLARRNWPQIGGVERHIFETARLFGQRGYKINIISERDIDYPHIKIAGLLFIWLWMVKNIGIFAKADIVHAHDVAIWYLPLRILLFWKPFYATFHGWEGKFPIPGHYIWLRKISAKIARGNICVGKYIEKWYGIKADYIIYGGIKNESKNRNGKIRTINKNVKILFLGRLQEDTGILNILKACDLLKNKYPSMEIQFLGDGSLRGEAEKYGRVLGFQKDIMPYLAKSRFIFTSGYLSMLEAMYAGRLVFAAYDNPLKRDTLRMSPFSRYAVVMNNPQELVQKIDCFLKNTRKEKEVIIGAYKWAQRQTWDKVTNIYLRLWKQAI